mmetsp:Transcript_146707/g.470796  ORF Transcript_146707/g.470796 Transcript_146707/m.470796 type:complete len:214 (-) Transcript_146707:850-1491(-)
MRQTKPTSNALESSAGPERCSRSIWAQPGKIMKSFSLASWANASSEAFSQASSLSFDAHGKPCTAVCAAATGAGLGSGRATSGGEAEVPTADAPPPIAPMPRKLTQVDANASWRLDARPKPELSKQETPTPKGASSCLNPSASALTKAIVPAKAHAPGTPGPAVWGAPTSRIRPQPLETMSAPKTLHKALVEPMLRANIPLSCSGRWLRNGPV